jgi:WD and tetratricopeptide repeat-containing protein 1
MVIYYSLALTIRGTSTFTSSLMVRVCIWTPDTSSTASSSISPHPMKLSTAIQTGHGANIFSAKFLPNAGTPTVVTVAGDHEIRLLEIERLSASGGHRMDQWQRGGAG